MFANEKKLLHFKAKIILLLSLNETYALRSQIQGIALLQKPLFFSLAMFRFEMHNYMIVIFRK